MVRTGGLASRGPTINDHHRRPQAPPGARPPGLRPGPTATL